MNREQERGAESRREGLLATKADISTSLLTTFGTLSIFYMATQVHAAKKHIAVQQHDVLSLEV
jgi:hypothetical protein